MKREKKIPRKTRLRLGKEKKKRKVANRSFERKLRDATRLVTWQEKRGEVTTI
jgi:hypothetical protein